MGIYFLTPFLRVSEAPLPGPRLLPAALAGQLTFVGPCACRPGAAPSSSRPRGSVLSPFLTSDLYKQPFLTPLGEPARVCPLIPAGASTGGCQLSPITFPTPLFCWPRGGSRSPSAHSFIHSFNKQVFPARRLACAGSGVQRTRAWGRGRDADDQQVRTVCEIIPGGVKWAREEDKAGPGVAGDTQPGH